MYPGQSRKLVLDLPLQWMARHKLSVFLFHKVPQQVDPLMAQDLDLVGFNRVLDFVQERFRVLPLADAVDCLQRQRLPQGAACITFDDGYHTWNHGAAAELQRRHLPATFFITTGQFQGAAMWHERVASALYAWPIKVFDLPGFGMPKLPMADIKQRRAAFNLIEAYLKYQPVPTRDILIGLLEQAAGVTPTTHTLFTAQHLRDLHSRGFEVGAHTVTHPILALCDHTTALGEIANAKATLQEVIGGKVSAFAYPNGRPGADFGAAHVQMVKTAGYAYAVTTQWGAARYDTPVFEIPRFTPWGPSPRRMALQVARNLATRPKLARKTIACHPTVLFVENGSGFGGAIVALQTLLKNFPPDSGVYHVATNLPVGNFASLPSVTSHVVIRDRLFDARTVAKGVQSLPLGPFNKLLLFLLGRVDDLVNRGPYMLRLALCGWRLRPDIIHGNNEPNANREAMLVAKLLRIPYVQHVRGPLGASRHTPWLLARPAAFIPVSRWLAGELAASGVTCHCIRQIYDAIDLQPKTLSAGDRTLRSELGLAPATQLVAMVGMLVNWKGQDLFLDAVAHLRDKAIGVSFLLIGGTPERGDAGYAAGLQVRCATLGLQDHVKLLGQRQDMAKLLPQINVVVSASTQPEPLGLVMLEAIANGCVFVGPAFGAATEVIVDGVTGYLFEPNVATSLAAKIQTAVQQTTALTAEITTAARKSIYKQFNGRICQAAIQKLYTDIRQ